MFHLIDIDGLELELKDETEQLKTGLNATIINK